ncbi:TP53-binding protein 1-like [Uloborus diversus]|uniref:TP53-binding protein 1-like n=1 Tax=Uloborus diversus TaxID=327109 RepID=UPI0024096175|nr:TP53-binding protein 1-like [Uloborus diversus]
MEESSGKSSEEEKKDKLSGGEYSSHHESDNDFTNSTLIDNDPVKVLQLSQPFFVADTLEDDDSMMISSQEDTVPFLIPSTPVEAGKGQGAYIRGEKEECITILDEVMILDMTQDLPDLDANTRVVALVKTIKVLDDDDDWNLKFSETQGTQDLMAVVAESPKMRLTLMLILHLLCQWSPQNQPGDIPPTPFKNADRMDDDDEKCDDVVAESIGNKSNGSSSNNIDDGELLKPELSPNEKDVIKIDCNEMFLRKKKKRVIMLSRLMEESSSVVKEVRIDVAASLPDIELPTKKKIADTTETKDEKLEVSSQSKPKEIVKNNTETPPTAMLPPLTSRVTSLRKQRTKPSDRASAISAVDTPENTSKHLVGSFKTKASLQRMLNSCGFSLDEEIEFPGEQPRIEVLSPYSGSSSSLSNKTPHSSDYIADVSSSSSGKLSPIKSEEKEEPEEKDERNEKLLAGKQPLPNQKATPKSNRSRSGRKRSAEDSDSSKKTESTKEVKPKKDTRSRKASSSKKDPVVVIRDIPVAEDSGGAYEESHFGNITPGVRVMARWKDGYYYPGTVQSQELEGRWVVMFDDGDTRTIAQENLMKLAMLQIGTSVLVQSSSDQFYDPGIVCGHFREGNKVGYEVELDSGVTRRYPRSCVILTTDQAKLITSSRPPTTPATVTINLDNIIDGKRKRKSVQSPVSTPVLKKSPRISQRTSKLDSNLDSTARSTGSSAGEAALPKSREPESTETEEDVKPRKRVRKAAARATSEVAKVLPKSNVKLFKDHAFLLTNADRKVIPRNDDSDNNLTEVEEKLFDKDQLCSDIISQGGLVLDKFEDIQKCSRKNIFLLANSYLRTIKYIQCLAAGILCIRHNFVEDCCLMDELRCHTDYLLPAGYSIVSDEIIDWHGKSDALKGLKIALISSNESHFVHIWAPVLLAAKADFVQKWTLPSSKSGSSAFVDVLITNHLCPQDVLQSAKRRKIPIVSSEWIIQSLIAGKRLSYNAHPKFKHDFTE